MVPFSPLYPQQQPNEVGWAVRELLAQDNPNSKLWATGPGSNLAGSSTSCCFYRITARACPHSETRTLFYLKYLGAPEVESASSNTVGRRRWAWK